MTVRVLCLTVPLVTTLSLHVATAQAPQPIPAAPEYDLYTMGWVVVTADAPPVEVARTTVVTAEEIRARNARTVAEVLTATPGIRVSSGRKAEPNVSIHGFDQSRILVLIDGVPYYETNYGKLDLNQIPTANVARIEVTKGAASVLYGANAMGGVVNIVTKRAADRPHTGATAELGEDGLQRYVVTHGMRHGEVSYWLNLSHEESDAWDVADDYRPHEGRIVYRSPNSTTPAILQGEGERTNSDVDRDDAWFKIGWERSADSAYWLNLHYLDMTKGLPPATDQVTVFLNRPAFSQLGRMPDYRDRGADFDLNQRLAERVVLKGKLFHHDHEDTYDSYGDLTFGERLARSTFKDSLSGGSLILESRLTEWNTARLALGYKVDSHLERDDTYLPFVEDRSNTGSVGLEDEVRVSEDLRAVIGISYDWFDVTGAERNVLDAAGDFVEQQPLARPSESSVNPMVGVSYTLGDHDRLFASLGQKTRFPLLSQLYSSRSGNPDLEPERSLNLNVGYNTMIDSTLSLETTGFWYDVTDLISRSGVDPTNVFQNYAEARVRGVEVGVSMAAAAGLELRGDLTWTDADDRSDGRVTEHVLNVPEWLVNVGLHWRLSWIPARLDLHGAYMDTVFTSLPSPRYPDDPVREVGGYVLTDARFGFDVTPKVELWGAVRNLFDVGYESESAYPGPGRALSVGLSARL